MGAQHGGSWGCRHTVGFEAPRPVSWPSSVCVLVVLTLSVLTLLVPAPAAQPGWGSPWRGAAAGLGALHGGCPGDSPVCPTASPPTPPCQAVQCRLSPVGSRRCRARSPPLPPACWGRARCPPFAAVPPPQPARHTQHGGAAPPATPNMAPAAPKMAAGQRRGASLNMAGGLPPSGKLGVVTSAPPPEAAAGLLWRRPRAARRWRRRCGR